MEIKEGNYIRTRKGIAKIIENNGDLLVVDKNGTIHDDCSFNEYVRREDIIDANESIIEIIRVGDYANGLLIIRISVDEETNKKYINLYGSMSEWEEEDIKSVVTKEQIESIKYEVE